MGHFVAGEEMGQFVAWGESGTFCHLGQFVAQKMPVGQFVVGTKCLLTMKNEFEKWTNYILFFILDSNWTLI